nr:5924_t:CDS:1 [Entrophospora candida]
MPSIFTGATTTAPTNSPYVTRNNAALTNSPPFDTCATISKKNSQVFNRNTITTTSTFSTIESPVINRTVAVPTKSPPVTRRASYIPTTKLPVITYSTNSPLPSSRIKIDNISLSPKKRKKVVYDDDKSPRNVRPKKFESFVNQIWEQNQEMIMKTQKLEQDYKNMVINRQSHEAELMKVSTELIETKNDCENMERRLREEKNEIKKLLEVKEELENDIKRLELESKRFDIFNELESKMNRG